MIILLICNFPVFLCLGVKGDLVLQLVPESLPAMSTDSQDQELDLTLEDVPSAATALEVTPGDQQGHGHDSDHQVPAAQRQGKEKALFCSITLVLGMDKT